MEFPTADQPDSEPNDAEDRPDAEPAESESEPDSGWTRRWSLREALRQAHWPSLRAGSAALAVLAAGTLTGYLVGRSDGRMDGRSAAVAAERQRDDEEFRQEHPQRISDFGSLIGDTALLRRLHRRWVESNVPPTGAVTVDWAGRVDGDRVVVMSGTFPNPRGTRRGQSLQYIEDVTAIFSESNDWETFEVLNQARHESPDDGERPVPLSGVADALLVPPTVSTVEVYWYREGQLSHDELTVQDGTVPRFPEPPSGSRCNAALFVLDGEAWLDMWGHGWDHPALFRVDLPPPPADVDTADVARALTSQEACSGDPLEFGTLLEAFMFTDPPDLDEIFVATIDPAAAPGAPPGPTFEVFWDTAGTGRGRVVLTAGPDA